MKVNMEQKLEFPQYCSGCHFLLTNFEFGGKYALCGLGYSPVIERRTVGDYECLVKRIHRDYFCINNHGE